MIDKPRVYIALPILGESDNIKELLNCFRLQEFRSFEIVACVNQYDSWWQNPDKEHICKDNQKSIELLNFEADLNIYIIDKSSKGNGWPKKKGGVGWARKTIMDYISDKSDPKDIIISIDADTYYPINYIQSVISFFDDNTELTGLSIPYYHKLNRDNTDRLILRYEIYMRYYLLNMIRINNPYCYTALGSAMAFPVWAYRKAGGLTPVVAGEDFYFLQKLVKIGTIGLWTSVLAYPSPRFSDRVSFGTGPALMKGSLGNWTSYPHYKSEHFDNVFETYSLFDQLFMEEIKTPMDEFLSEQTKYANIWAPLRKNYKDQKNFCKACSNKVDGLRILQYLRKQHEDNIKSDEDIIIEYLHKYHESEMDSDLLLNIEGLDYEKSPIRLLNTLRDFLFDKEMELRKFRFVNIN